jgi:nucleoside-diphosphate-sugar epimerase
VENLALSSGSNGTTSSMKILVTGAEGYIGSVLAPLLLERGYEVVTIDTGFYRGERLYNHIAARLPALINKDIRNVTERDLEGFQAIVHLAELSNDPLGQFNPEVTYQINHLGTVDLARKCKRVGVRRFVYTSSCSVYGIGTDGFRTEQSEVNPQTAYAKCKVLVERDLGAMADDDFSPTFLRNATAYGPSPSMRFDLVLNNLAGCAWGAGEIKMTSDGTPWRPLVHVRDICEAISCVLKAPRELIHREIFNVGENQANYRVKEIAEIVSDVFRGCRLTLGKNGGDNRSYRVAFDKIHERLPGFKCRRDARDGAEELLSLFRKIEMSNETFQSKTFTRLKQLEYLVRTRQIDEQLFWHGDA